MNCSTPDLPPLSPWVCPNSCPFLFNLQQHLTQFIVDSLPLPPGPHSFLELPSALGCPGFSGRVGLAHSSHSAVRHACGTLPHTASFLVWDYLAFCLRFGSLSLYLPTLESPLDCKESQPVHPKGDQSWIFIGRTDAEAETPILWPPDAKSWLIGKTLMLGKTEGRRRGDDRGWDGWMASPTLWTGVWVNSGSWWWTGRLGVLQSMGSQRVGHDWVTELDWAAWDILGLVWDISPKLEYHFSSFVLLSNSIDPFPPTFSRKSSLFSFARDTSPDIPDSLIHYKSIYIFLFFPLFQ